VEAVRSRDGAGLQAKPTPPNEVKPPAGGLPTLFLSRFIHDATEMQDDFWLSVRRLRRKTHVHKWSN
jgi:hypothetical protein